MLSTVAFTAADGRTSVAYDVPAEGSVRARPVEVSSQKAVHQFMTTASAEADHEAAAAWGKSALAQAVRRQQ